MQTTIRATQEIQRPHNFGSHHIIKQKTLKCITHKRQSDARETPTDPEDPVTDNLTAIVFMVASKQNTCMGVLGISGDGIV